jgi:glycosyltransferase involved in cell wall biosynthesis
MQKNVLYVHVGLSSFVVKDIAIIERNHRVIPHLFSVKSKKALLLAFVKQFFFLLLNGRKAKLVVIQFAGYQSFFPVIFARFFRFKTVIILGGTDCVSFPSIQYGCHYNSLLRPFTGYSMRKAHLLLPVDQSLVHCEYTYTASDFKHQGYQSHVENCTTPYRVIPNGYDPSLWKRTTQKESNTFVTVGSNFSFHFSRLLKGIDLIVGIAPFFPDCIFFIVGGDNLPGEVPTNVRLIQNLPNAELPRFLSDKRFYLQLSMSEGFPNALCEAMLCECVPIVSQVGPMPLIIGETGYVLKEKDRTQLVSLIRSALEKSTEAQGKMARSRIANDFTLENRSELLLSTLQTLLEKK